jgi:hypothetical protein
MEVIPKEAQVEMEKNWKEISGAAYGDANVKHPWFVKKCKELGARKYYPVAFKFLYVDGSTGMRFIAPLNNENPEEGCQVSI